MTVFDFEVITWHRHLQLSQCLIPASVPPAMIVDGNVKSPRVSNIDHRAAMPNRHTTAITARSSAPIGDREGLAALWPDPTGGIVARSANTHLSPRASARPRCPKCQSRTELQRITAARTGFEHWTLRCIKCGLIHEAQVNADPMKSDSIGWEHRELTAPQ
jgi:hypothetical protein